MAHLEVEPKPSRPWWIWLIIFLLLAALIGLLLNKYGSELNGNSTDTVSEDSISAPIAQ